MTDTLTLPADLIRRDVLDDVIRMNGPVYRRIRQNCCDESGLPPIELDRHAASVVLTLKTAHETNRRRPPSLPGATGAARRSTV